MTQDQLKQAVAQAAVDLILPKLDDKSIVGVGTGSTANFFIDALAQHKMDFDGAVASSDATAARTAARAAAFDASSGAPIAGSDDLDELAGARAGAPAGPGSRLRTAAPAGHRARSAEERPVQRLGRARREDDAPPARQQRRHLIAGGDTRWCDGPLTRAVREGEIGRAHV